MELEVLGKVKSATLLRLHWGCTLGHSGLASALDN